MKVKYFHKELRTFPKITGIGDIVLIRSIKRTSWAQAPSLLSSYYTFTQVFPAISIPRFDFSAAVASGSYALEYTSGPQNRSSVLADSAAQLYVQQLRHWAVQNLILPAPAPAQSLGLALQLAPSPGKKSKELREVKEGDYADIVGEVVRVWVGAPGYPSTVYVTDYTTNPYFYQYDSGGQVRRDGLDGDDFGYTGAMTPGKGWTGPLGKQTAQITLWHPHAQAVPDLHEKDIVKMRNVRFKTKRGGFLEGAMHEDRKHPNEIMIRKYKQTDDPKYANILRRGEAYWASRGQVAEKPLSKKQRKKRKQQEKKEREAAERKLRDGENVATAGQESEAGIGSTKPPVSLPNIHVRCADPSHPLTTIAYITNQSSRAFTPSGGREITLPFVNRKAKLRARVVDFFPPSIVDFSHSLDDSAYNNAPDDPKSSSSVSIDMPSSGMTSGRWEWSFFLALQDADAPQGSTAPVLRVLVSQKGADYLLKLTASDLRKDKKALAELREKLFILWGDLEEIKSRGALGTQKASSKPFDCWVQEYGVPFEENGRTGFVRMHSMLDTTIM